jgi:signal peptidase II
MSDADFNIDRRGRWIWYFLVVVIIVCDQASKDWIVQHFYLGERLNVLPFFDLTLVYNEGAAWSFLSDAGGWQRWLFTGISSVVSVVLMVWMFRVCNTQRYLLIALTLILAGAVGNLIDRVLLGKVVDFLLVYYQHSEFPVFNVADSAISIGAVFLILDAFTQPKSNEDADAKEK